MFRDLIDDFDDYSPDPEKFLDVPFVPTDNGVIEAMLELGEVCSRDIVYDLGSGDGRILVAAAKERCARGIGIEIDPLRIADAMEYAGNTRVEYLVDFIEGDIFDADVSEATVVTLYLLDSVNVQLRPMLLSQLRPGARIISHAFDMGDWRADKRLEVGGINIYKWIVPAQVQGTWEWDGVNGEPYRVELQQKYQEITGQAWESGVNVPLAPARLHGNFLELKIGKAGTPAARNFLLTFDNDLLDSVVDVT